VTRIARPVRFVCRPKSIALILTAFSCDYSALAQAQSTSPGPAGSPGTLVARPSPPAAAPGNGDSAQAKDPEAQKKFAALSNELKERIGLAANKVMLPLMQAENNLYRRFTYFEKPERLDPGTFASKDEVVAWKESLKQFRGEEDTVERLYANVADNLENALIAQRINTSLATSIKQQLVSTIPWETVQKKEKLIGQFIDDHGKLLNFYETNWGTWKPNKRPDGTPEFSDAKLAGAYQQLRNKIASSGQQIVQLYAKLQQ